MSSLHVGSVEKVKRKRASAPKVKTGCVTCKARHVKCDEGKPECQRCTSTGRICEGYFPIPDRAGKGKSTDQDPPPSGNDTNSSRSDKGLSSSPGIVVERPLVSVSVNPSENRSLDYFFNKAVPQLAGHFDTPFWRRLSMQLGRQEPAIRHAMMAVSAIHEGHERKDPQAPSAMHANQRFAMQHYNKAMQSLATRLSTGQQAVEVVLMACILFICLEFIRGDAPLALTHLESGLKIVEQWQRRDSQSSSPGSIDSSTSSSSSLDGETADDLVRAFSRLAITGSLFDKIPETVAIEARETLEEIPASFASLAEARVVLTNLINTSLAFIKHVLPIKNNFKAGIQEAKEKALIQIQLESWRKTLESYVWRQISRMSSEEREAVNLLRIHHKVMAIWMDTSLCAEECSFDKHKAEFQQIIDLTESIVLKWKPLGATNQNLSNFSFDLSFIPPLYLTALKCRYRKIRLKAIQLLHYIMPLREGLWCAKRSYVITKRIMELEEGGIESGNPSELPPEWSRIHHAHITCASQGSEPIIVEFISKPDGLMGEWRHQKELLEMTAEDFSLAPEIECICWPYLGDTSPSSKSGLPLLMLP